MWVLACLFVFVLRSQSAIAQCVSNGVNIGYDFGESQVMKNGNWITNPIMLPFHANKSVDLYFWTEGNETSFTPGPTGSTGAVHAKFTVDNIQNQTQSEYQMAIVHANMDCEMWGTGTGEFIFSLGGDGKNCVGHSLNFDANCSLETCAPAQLNVNGEKRNGYGVITNGYVDSQFSLKNKDFPFFYFFGTEVQKVSFYISSLFLAVTIDNVQVRSNTSNIQFDTKVTQDNESFMTVAWYVDIGFECKAEGKQLVEVQFSVPLYGCNYTFAFGKQCSHSNPKKKDPGNPKVIAGVVIGVAVGFVILGAIGAIVYVKLVKKRGYATIH